MSASRLMSFSLVISSLGASPLAAAQDSETVLPSVTVTAPAETETPAYQQLDPNQLNSRINPLAGDAAEALRNEAGVSASRMGGHGLDLIIRGQSQTQLNIVSDGAYTHGGCPNRMDPPTAYTPLDTYDQVTIIRGAQTVQHGGGGSGGTVLLERETAPFSEGEAVRGRVYVGGRSNSDTVQAGADVAAGTDKFYARGQAHYQDADNYQDGDGNTTRSAYQSQTGALMLGYRPNKDGLIELSAEANRIDDALYAGAGMDSPKSDNDALRLHYEQNFQHETWHKVSADVYQTDVEHVMDNFSLRSLTAPMKMQTDSSSTTRGGRIVGAFFSNQDWLWTVGVDYQENQRDALRMAGMPMADVLTMQQALLWPDVELAQSGMFSEVELPLSEVQLLKLGLRYDYVQAKAQAANRVVGSSSPNALYQQYYGVSADQHTEHNLGGFARFSQQLNAQVTAFASISRAVRTADATERYLASANSQAAMRWIGNPNIDPEQHHQADLGLSWQGTRSNASITGFANDVTDYILRDHARGQAGIVASDGATIYRNVDARLYGAEFSGRYAWNQQCSSQLTLTYTYGENRTDNLPLAQIPPLSGSMDMNCQYDRWFWRGVVHAAARQSRIDADPLIGTGLDTGETAAYAVLNLSAGWQVWQGAELQGGIDNVFDTTYAYHVNRANSDPFNPDPVQVNEEGRAFWVRLGYRF